jgi:hypothetical protein
MGLLGEVRISEDPDYENWGLEIMVSFRDNTEMRVLNKDRQSGGVRSSFSCLYAHARADKHD